MDYTNFETSAKPKFGPSGNSNEFLSRNFKSSVAMPSWISNMGLELYEYSFGRGIHISDAHAQEIGKACDDFNVELSVHAPYYINFASIEDEKAENSKNYLLNSVAKLKQFGGKRCVFHIGAQGKQERKYAFEKARTSFIYAMDCIAQAGLSDLIICPETMGKQAQIGTVDEVIEICNIAPNIFPCLDFGHINSLEGGSLKDAEAFQRIVDKLFDGLGEEKTKNMHVHFSKIQYGEKGEIRHLTFEDKIYGPEFEPFAEVIVKNNLSPHILSESNGTQDIDALSMKNMFLQEKDRVENL